MSKDARCAERFLCTAFGTVVKPISDLRLLISGLSAMLFALCFSASAQQPKRVPQVGYLSASSASEALPRAEAFRRGLRELGYVEGKNIVLEFRYAEGKFDRLPALTAELVRLKVDAIVSAGPQ